MRYDLKEFIDGDLIAAVSPRTAIADCRVVPNCPQKHWRIGTIRAARSGIILMR